MSGVRGPRIETSGRGRFYVWRKTRYWSVTTILSGGMPKPVLINWAKKVTAEYALEHLAELNAIAKKDRDGAVDWLKRAADRSRDKAANLGSLVHDASEAHVLERPVPAWTDEQAPYMGAFMDWLADFQPHFEAVEAPCFSIRHRYAGTLDAIATVGDTRYLIDYKTSKGVYPEVGLQLAAYRFSETFIGLPDGDETPTPEVDGCAVVHLRPEGYEFIPIRADEEIFRSFLYVREVFRFTQELADTVVGSPLVSDEALGRQLERSLSVSERAAENADGDGASGQRAAVPNPVPSAKGAV